MRIKDELLEPYSIRHNGNCFTVDKDLGSEDKDGNILYDNEGYFSNVKSALGKVMKLKLHNNKDVVSLEEYLMRLEGIKKRYEELLEKYDI